MKFVVAMLAALAASAAATVRPRDCPNCAPLPVAGSLPWFSPTADGGFTAEHSTRFKNRPLYGPHQGGLVLAGDRPIAHIADDATLYGGVLFGLRRGDVAVWAHDADDLESTFVAASVRWHVRDTRLPGLQLSAAVMHTASGTGAVLDINVTDDGSGGALPAELVWSFGCGTTPAGSQRLGWTYDPLVNPQTLTWTFSPADCVGNRVAIDASNRSLTLSFGSSTVAVAIATNAHASVTTGDASQWANMTALLAAREDTPEAPPQASAQSPLPLPLPGATLWLHASSLSPTHGDGAPVAAWADEAGGGALDQADPARRPKFDANGLGPGAAGVRFDGAAAFLSSAVPTVGAESTTFAVIRDGGSTGGDGACCSGVVFWNGSFTGVATRPQAGAVVTTLDWAGSDGYGHTDIRGRPVVAASVYRLHGPSASYVDGCAEFTGAAVSGVPSAGGVMVGTRNNELRRFFLGAIGEIVVYPRALNVTELAVMQAYFSTLWPVAPAPAPAQCAAAGPLAVGRVALPAGPATTRVTWAALANAGAPASAVDPVAQLAAAQARAARLTRAAAAAPDPLVAAAVGALGPAVDGLFRDDPGIFVHGAMAWDSPYVGWRSEYGGTVLGWPAFVASEGAYFVSKQIRSAPGNTVCVSDPSLLLTQEGPTSRFHGRGRIDVDGSIYDMQTQFFDQQIHMWRWTGNASHEALLRPALALHAEWARDCFDGDGDGLYSSYANTWPTDSQFYSGGATWEETSYMYRVNIALRDMAARAGNATEAAAYGAVARAIAGAVPALWVTADGHPAASREENGHRRLRPDAWLYSVFLPIEAGLLSQEQAAQALHYTEWGLERDAIFCDAANGTNATCGEVVWTSNYVPSQWSVRQLWSGDNSGLTLAYFLTGLPDDGWAVLRGTLHRDMLQSAVPGQAGGANGGTDFNDAVHPLARALIEGLFGVRPDYPAGVVTVAPQLPSTWARASLDTSDVVLAIDAAPEAGGATLTVALARPAPRLLLRVPVRAAALARVDVTGLPPGADFNTTTEAGFGEAVLVVSAAAGPDGPLLAAATVVLTFAGGALPCVPSVAVAATETATVTLAAPPGLTLVGFTDPQGVLAPGSAHIDGGGVLTGIIAAGVRGAHLVFGSAATANGALTQRIMFKLTVAAAPLATTEPAVATLAAAAAAWTLAPLDSVLNDDVAAIFAAGRYVSPRPATCALRLGSDGWSAWTFPYWSGPPPPKPDFSLVANMSIGGGVIVTPQGAHFLLAVNASGGEAVHNVAFASLWDGFPATITAPVPSAPAATTAWVLLVASTNPMQTLLPNAVLRFRYTDGSADALNLVPPRNLWALAGWGNADYDYATDAFCLPPVPPPTVQLGAANRAMLYAHALRRGAVLAAVELEALSPEVVVGVLAVSLSE